MFNMRNRAGVVRLKYRNTVVEQVANIEYLSAASIPNTLPNDSVFDAWIRFLAYRHHSAAPGSRRRAVGKDMRPLVAILYNDCVGQPEPETYSDFVQPDGWGLRPALHRNVCVAADVIQRTRTHLPDTGANYVWNHRRIER